MADSLKKYLFDNHSVKLHALRLNQTWLDAQVHHNYPPAVQRILGELVTAAVLLASNLKFDGSLVLQLQGDGPIALMVVECTADLGLRATVRTRNDDAIAEDSTLRTLISPNGKGRFIVVLDPARKMPGQQAYQGIVPIERDSVAHVLEHYMLVSEQLETRLLLAANASFTAGLLLQRLPHVGGTLAAGMHTETLQATWEHACHLTATVKPDELLGTDTDSLVHRLFWDDTLLAFEPQPVRWYCPCNRQRIVSMLRMLGAAEIDSILAERGGVEVLCDFCGKPYYFDAVDCAGLFAQPASMPTQDPPTCH